MEALTPDATSIRKAIETALVHHDARRLAEAEAIYRDVLRTAPKQPDALHLLGMIAYQSGNNAGAFDLVSQALSVDPSNPEYHHDLAIVLQRLGRLDDAVVSYRAAIALKPDYVDAHFNIAMVLQHQRKPDEAIESYRTALVHDPKLVDGYNNLGALLQQQGKLDEAVLNYRKAVALDPRSADLLYNMANALKDQGKLDEAQFCYREALSQKPDHAAAHHNVGAVLQHQGKLDEAIASYRKAISLKPDLAMAHGNLGYALLHLGHPEEAVRSYRAALLLEPDIAESHSNLGMALGEAGQVGAALSCYLRALELKESQAIKTSFARFVRSVNFIQVDPVVRRLLARALSEPWARPADLASVSIKLLTLDPNISECIERASGAWPKRLSSVELFGAAGLQAVSDDVLLRALLESTQICELALERFLTMVRNVVLDAAMGGAGSDDSGDNVLNFYCAVARQCFVTEFVFSHADEEYDRARLLRDKLIAAMQAGTTVPALWVVAVAGYFPLFSLPAAATLLGESWPEPVTALLVQQIGEPLEEHRSRDAIRRLTGVDDEVSRRVRQQYEENPYPRWIKLPPPGNPVSLFSYLRQTFPFAPIQPLGNGGDLDILVAGCGTGQEAIETAQQSPAARVLAVDLSLTSLAYAQRKTRERGLANIEYAQGDITGLGSLGRSFDVITAVGVLHHLADPKAGWRQLRSLLRPGGLMRLGFYSERARHSIVAAREFIVQRGYGSTAPEIRRCREDLLALENGAQFKQLMTIRDFYVTSELRDLLLHVQEHRFTLPEIKGLLKELGLDFIGFLLEPHVNRRYSARFPDDKARTNLDHWNNFESDFPDTFINMYAFWVQKPL